MRITGLFLLAAVVLFSGCATSVKVTTVPSGAAVWARGSGRAAYKWELKGGDGVAYKSYYSTDLVMAVWDDGIRSEPVRVPHMFEKEVEVELVKPGNE